MSTKFDHCLEELCKMAEEPKKNRHIEVAKVVGSGLAGLGLGHIAGAVAGKGLEHIGNKMGTNPADLARKVIPIIGTASGILYPLWKSQEQRAIQDVVESTDN